MTDKTVAIIGVSGVGKTKVLGWYRTSKFIDGYHATFESKFIIQEEYKDSKVDVTYLDTGGKPAYKKKIGGWLKADAILLVYNPEDEKSLSYLSELKPQMPPSSLGVMVAVSNTGIGSRGVSLAQELFEKGAPVVQVDLSTGENVGAVFSCLRQLLFGEAMGHGVILLPTVKTSLSAAAPEEGADSREDAQEDSRLLTMSSLVESSPQKTVVQAAPSTPVAPSQPAVLPAAPSKPLGPVVFTSAPASLAPATLFVEDNLEEMLQNTLKEMESTLAAMKELLAQTQRERQDIVDKEKAWRRSFCEDFPSFSYSAILA